jgi:hypothetical protein
MRTLLSCGTYSRVTINIAYVSDILSFNDDDPRSSHNMLLLLVLLHTQNCFGSWQAAMGSRCKCPNCNVLTQSFVKIFIALEHGADGGEDDDISLNSTDSTSDDNDNDVDSTNADNHTNDSNIETAEEEGLFEMLDAAFQAHHENDDSDDDCQIIDTPPSVAAAASATNSSNGMVDLTLSPPSSPPQRARGRRQASADSDSTANKKKKAKSSTGSKNSGKNKTSSSSDNNNDSSSGEETKRLKEIAKRYKLRWKQQHSQLREAVDQQNALRQQLGGAKDELAETTDELESMIEHRSAETVQLDGLQLRVVQLSAAADRSQSQYEACKKDHTSALNQLTKLRVDYKKEIDRARHDSMAEVQTLLKEHPKLVQENQELKEALKRHQRDHPPRSIDRTNSSSSEVKRFKNSKNEMAKALRQMDEVRQIKGGGDAKNSISTERKQSKSFDVTKYSTQSARLAKATQRNNFKSSSSSSSAASKMWDFGGGKEDIPSAVARKSANVGASALQRADSTSSRTTSTVTKISRGHPVSDALDAMQPVATRKRKLVEKQAPKTRVVPSLNFGQRRLQSRHHF